jgi:deoxyribonuclease-4
VTLLGAHVPSADPLAEATARRADLVQVFLSNPQSWKAPIPREDAEELRTSGVPVYVHAPYLINVASPNNRVRIPSRKMLAQTAVAATAIGAAGVIVHGGHIGDGEAAAVGYERWRKALEPLDSGVPILIENTAGGGHAVTRELVAFGPLWQEIGDLGAGVCLDTCHAWAAGEDLAAAAGIIVDLTGRLDLIHCNDSRDPHDSRRDRHDNLGRGEIPEALLIAAVTATDAPVVVETPGDASEQAADLDWLRRRLAAD